MTAADAAQGAVGRPEPWRDPPYGNVPLYRYQHDGMTVVGWSRAAVTTCWAIPELKILFDQGAPVWDLAGIGRLAITHAHPDHMVGLPSYVATRAMMAQQASTTVYVPSPIALGVRELLDCWERLTGDTYRPEIVGCNPGDRIPLGQDRFLVPFEVTHVIPCQGYMVTEERRKLKPEFANVPGEVIAEIRRAGREVSDLHEVPVVAYCGDTTVECLDRNPRLYDARILILECTFTGEEPDRRHARRYGHVHLSELVERAALFRNELLVLGHFSTRKSARENLEVLARSLPPELLARTVAWL